MYQWNPEEYAKNSSAQKEWADQLIRRLNLQGTEKILDIGCGDGKITFELAEIVKEGQVVGMDLSGDMVRFASQHYQVAKHQNLCFVRADASGIPFRKVFDVVFSNAALHWISDHRPVLAGIYQSLSSRGRILFQMGGRGNARAIFHAFDEVASQPRWMSYFHGFSMPYAFFSPEEYQSLLTDAGFAVKRVELIPKDMVQKGRDGLAGWMRTTWHPVLERVPEDLREEFIAELIDDFLMANPLDKNGDAHVQMVRLEVEACADYQ